MTKGVPRHSETNIGMDRPPDKASMATKCKKNQPSPGVWLNTAFQHLVAVVTNYCRNHLELAPAMSSFPLAINCILSCIKGASYPFIAMNVDSMINEAAYID